VQQGTRLHPDRRTPCFHEEYENAVLATLQNLDRADTVTHLGIKRDNKSKTGTKEVVADRIQIVRRTVYALMGAGLHGLSGLNPRMMYRSLFACNI
jgi:hypothetical protein